MVVSNSSMFWFETWHYLASIKGISSRSWRIYNAWRKKIKHTNSYFFWVKGGYVHQTYIIKWRRYLPWIHNFQHKIAHIVKPSFTKLWKRLLVAMTQHECAYVMPRLMALILLSLNVAYTSDEVMMFTVKHVWRIFQDGLHVNRWVFYKPIIIINYFTSWYFTTQCNR